VLNSTTPLNSVVPCSFNQESFEVMVCCPPVQVTDRPSTKPKPRYLKNNKPYLCEDKTKYCNRWKDNGICFLNKTFIPSEIEKALRVSSQDMFAFTTMTCMGSCNWCGDKGCVDEHESCPRWAKEGFCTGPPTSFISHTCRESCGLCGFLSPFNTETQVLNGRSYTRNTQTDFDCGRVKSLVELEEMGYTVIKAEVGEASTDNFDLRNAVDGEDDLREVSFLNNRTEVSCTATIISDRWMVTAAHCSDFYGVEGQQKKIRIQAMRTTVSELLEYIEVKNVYIHPEYEVGSYYNDIALIELGRRIEFDFERFGDTPECIDQGIDLDGKLVSIQGFGISEDGVGTNGNLLTTNNTLLNVAECTEKLGEYLITHQRKRKSFCKNFKYGVLENRMICTEGIRQADGVISGACKGDSGGLVEYLNPKGGEDLRTIVGIISGSLSCAGNAPEWNTRIAFYREWINCITSAGKGNEFNKADVESVCLSTVPPYMQRTVPQFCQDQS